MRFGLLTQWFDPEPGPAALPGVLARALAERGHEVRVLTGFPNYPSGRLAPGYRMARRARERVAGVDITRVALYPSHDASAARRVANYASFGVSAAVSGRPALAGLDALWVNYSPITVAAPMWLARYAAGVPLVVHVADLWPDTLTAGGFAPGGGRSLVGRAVESALHAWCGAMYASAHTVTYIAPGVRDVLAARGVPDAKLAYAPMWADEAMFRPTATLPPTQARAQRQEAARFRARVGAGEGDVLVLYAGAIGPAQGLETLVRAAAAAPPHGLRVAIAGSGIAEPGLRALAGDLSRAAGRDVVTFVGRVPAEQMPTLMAAADACYIGLNDDPLAAITMPSKTQATLAAGRSIVVAADGDVLRVVTEAGAGQGVGSGDVAGLTRVLAGVCQAGRDELDARGAAGRRYYEETFAVRRAVDRAEAALTAAAGARRRGRGRA